MHIRAPPPCCLLSCHTVRLLQMAKLMPELAPVPCSTTGQRLSDDLRLLVPWPISCGLWLIVAMRIAAVLLPPAWQRQYGCRWPQLWSKSCSCSFVGLCGR